MNNGLSTAGLVLKRHGYGRFDKRMPIGPVSWNFHDLLWIHEGRTMIEFPDLAATVDLAAPAGVLILPNTAFSGRALDGYATASICHFECQSINPPFIAPGYMLPLAEEKLHLQNLIRLAMVLAKQTAPAALPRRQRLLHAILDGFHFEREPAISSLSGDKNRLATAWASADQNLPKIRSLSDVAAVLGIQESRFRALHRAVWQASAGEHLRQLRLKKAEELLATTGFSIAEIARQVGYAHAETLSAAFKKYRGQTPGQYRRWSNPFA